MKEETPKNCGHKKWWGKQHGLTTRSKNCPPCPVTEMLTSRRLTSVLNAFCRQCRGVDLGYVAVHTVLRRCQYISQKGTGQRTCPVKQWHRGREGEGAISVPQNFGLSEIFFLGGKSTYLKMLAGNPQF